MRAKVKVELNMELLENVIVKCNESSSNRIFVFGYKDAEKESTYYFVIDSLQEKCDVEMVISLILSNGVVKIKSFEDITESDEPYLSRLPLIVYCNNVINNMQIDYIMTGRNQNRYYDELIQSREFLNYYLS